MSSGRKYRNERIDTAKALNFDIPERNPANVPSLRRPPTQVKKNPPISRVAPKDMPLKVEQDLAVAASRPVPPLSPKLFPTKKEEKVPNLLDLI